jgi:hypothetical protein
VITSRTITSIAFMSPSPAHSSGFDSSKGQLRYVCVIALAPGLHHVVMYRRASCRSKRGPSDGDGIVVHDVHWEES